MYPAIAMHLYVFIVYVHFVIQVGQDEMISSHYIEVKADAGGSKMMLPVKAKEKLQLVRKTDCPDKKWIVRDPRTGAR